MVKNESNRGFRELFSFLSIIKRGLLSIKNEVDVDKILQKKYGRHLGHYKACVDYVFCLNFHQYFEGVISQNC